MTPFLSICSLFLSLSVVWAAEPESKEVKLGFLAQTDPALTGYLGDPSLGFQVTTSHQKIVWLPGDKLLISQKHPGSPGNQFSIQYWQEPTATTQAKLVGLMNLMGVWAVSTKGKNICGQVYRPTTGTSHYDKEEYNALSCYSFEGGKRLWKMPLSKGDLLRAVCFSADDKTVLAAVSSSSSVSLFLLLNAETGQELERVILPADTGFCQSDASLVRLGNGFLALTAKDGLGAWLWDLKLNPLRVEAGNEELLRGKSYHSLHLGSDETSLVLSDYQKYQVASLEDGVWKASYNERDNTHFVEHLNDVAISPDGRYLCEAYSKGVHVIDLQRRELVKSFALADGCDALTYSPDGRHVLLTPRDGFPALLDTKNWELREHSMDNQHTAVPGNLQFLSEETLLSNDRNGFIVWDLASKKPRALLRSNNPGALFSAEAFIYLDQSKELIAGDYKNYLKWKLPDLSKPVPQKPERIEGSMLIENTPNSGSTNDILGNGTWLLTHSRADMTYFYHDVRKPGVVKTLKALKELFMCSNFYLLDEKLALVKDAEYFYHFDLVNDTLTRLDRNPSNSLKPWLPIRKWVITRNDRQIQFLDAHTTKVVKTLSLPKGQDRFASPETDHWLQHGGNGITVSANEKMVAVFMKSPYGENQSVSFWDIEEAKLLGVQAMPNMNCLNFALSPSGKTLAVSHRNGSISTWDVSKSVENWSASSTKAPDVPVKAEAKVTYVDVMRLPDKALVDELGDKWLFNSDGTCVVEGKLPSFSKLKVNGKDFESETVSYFNTQGKERLASPFRIQSLGKIADTSLAVSRFLSTHYSFWGGRSTVQAIDGFTNLTSDWQKIEIVLETQLPTDCQGLLKGSNDTIHLQPDGRFFLDKHEHWVLPSGSGKVGESLAAIRVNNYSSSRHPEMHWDKKTKILKLRYEVDIPPAETRWLAHGAAMLERVPEGDINMLKGLPFAADVSEYIAPGNHYEGVNFARLTNAMRLPSQKSIQYPLADLKTFLHDRLYMATMDDGLGFSWEVKRDLGRVGKLGATSIFQVWLDGRPANLNGRPLLLYHDRNASALMVPASLIMKSTSAKIQVSRITRDLTGDTSTVWKDKYTNTGDTAESVKVGYLTTFHSPVVEVWGESGKKWDVAAFHGPASEVGGACAFVLRGEEKPATLLAFHRSGSAVTPSIRWMGAQAVSLDYEFQLKPGESATLLHGACQRPLSAYEDVSSAFAEWLPLQLPPPLSATSQEEEMVTPLNYPLAPK